MLDGSRGGAGPGVPMVSIRGLRKSYGGHLVLDDVDLEVGAAEVVVIAGPSGSGKSTLCRCINRLEVPDSGEVTIGGQPVPLEGRQLARIRAEVGMVFHKPASARGPA